MDILSIMGATVSLECAALLIAAALFLDLRRSWRLRRLLANIQSTLDTAPAPAVQEELRPQAA